MFKILYYCGLKKGEFRGLTWKNIDLINKTLSVKKQITDHGGYVKEFLFFTPKKTKSSIKTLTLNKVLLNDHKMLKEKVSKEYGFNDDYFVIGDVFPVASNTITSRKNRNCELAGVPQIRIHDFRHFCAYLLVNNGANITVVAKYLGHTKTEETLNAYTHLFNYALNEGVDLIDSLNYKSIGLIQHFYKLTICSNSSTSEVSSSFSDINSINFSIKLIINSE